jgi:hypothetical protein
MRKGPTTLTASRHEEFFCRAEAMSGRLSDFWIRKGYTTTLVRKTMMAVGFATAAIALAACAARPHTYLPWLMTVGVGSGMLGAGTFAFPRRSLSRSGWMMDWPAKRLRKPGRCGRTCADRIRSGADRQFWGPDGNHYRSVDGRCNSVGVRSRPSRAGELGGKGRGFGHRFSSSCRGGLRRFSRGSLMRDR